MSVHVDYDNDGSYIACGSGASIDNIFIGGGTITYWLYGVDDNSGRIGKGDQFQGVNTGWGTQWLATKIVFIHGWNTLRGKWTTDNAVAANTWAHVAIIYDKGSVNNNPTIYINSVSSGLAENNTPNGTVANDSGSNLDIGRSYYNTAAGGGDCLVADFRMFGSSLTAEQVAQLAAGYRGPIGGEAMWLSMIESRGAFAGTLTQGTHLLPDLSANPNDGDPTGGADMQASKAPRYGVAV